MSAKTARALGQYIRSLRERRGWRQIDLAAHAEISKTQVSDVESGKRDIRLGTLEKIAKGLDTKPSEMLRAINR